MAEKEISTLKEFEARAAAPGGVFLLFYYPSCPYCVSFLPDFEPLAASAPSRFRKVRADLLPELEDRFAVDVVPTVLYFKSGALAARLDGALGRGLSARDLEGFAAAHGGRP